MSLQRKGDNSFTYFDNTCQGNVDWFLRKYKCNNTINLFSFSNTPICISGS